MIAENVKVDHNRKNEYTCLRKGCKIMKKIILASGSPRRKEIMEQVGYTFEILASEKEECYTSRIPSEIVKELALLKARDVSDRVERKNVIVIGADTIVALEKEILGKPSDTREAFHMLKNLQGRKHEVYTGVAILTFDGDGTCSTVNHAVKTDVFVNPMTEQEIWEYIESGEPMDKAGAYGIQGRFAAYIDKIDGDYYNVMGLPVSYIYREIKEN